MHVFEMVLGIVLIGCIASIFKHYFETKQERLRAEANVESIDMARLEQLEERVRVLESIVTDKSYSLKREIENL